MQADARVRRHGRHWREHVDDDIRPASCPRLTEASRDVAKRWDCFHRPWTFREDQHDFQSFFRTGREAFLEKDSLYGGCLLILGRKRGNENCRSICRTRDTATSKSGAYQ